VTTTPDPRPKVTGTDVAPVIAGWRCATCQHPLMWAPPRCPLCGGALEAALFGPAGTVWSSTVVRVPVPGRTPPYGMAYVDFDDGPRVLAHVADTGSTTQRIAPGTRVAIVGETLEGDVLVAVGR
jgi:uncharacterized protein